MSTVLTTTTISTMTENSAAEMALETVVEVVSSSEAIHSSSNVSAMFNPLAAGQHEHEHEEGEIDDDEDEVGKVQYEDISSDEEFVNIRERIAELEARDTELGLLNGITGRTAAGPRNAHHTVTLVDAGKENYECISDDEDIELYQQRYDPVPKPKLLPVRRATRSARTGYHSVRSNTRSRHAESRRRLERRKHVSSTRKSIVHRRHKRRKSRVSAIPVDIRVSSDSEVEPPLDRARLQAACNINNGKRKTDKQNWDALKKKLKLSLRKRQKEEESAAMGLQDQFILIEDDDDDQNVREEEDVFQLRLQALESKPEVKEPNSADLLTEAEMQEKIMEEQELRMIALQSAFTKKHQIRLKKRQGERPYSPSDEIPLLSPARDFMPATGERTEEVDDEDDVLIIESRPETVEIRDSSSDEENRMEISPSCSPECPEPPNITSIDMELATSGDSRSPVIEGGNTGCDSMPAEHFEELDAPPPPIISDLQCTLPEEEDEELLRNQLLSTLSTAASAKSVSQLEEKRPLTPDSMVEEEADALREVLLSKMNKKTSRLPEHARDVPSSQTDLVIDIPQINQQPLPTTVDPYSVSNIDFSLVQIAPQAIVAPPPAPPQPALIVAPTANQSRVQSNPNLITLIGKHKAVRKKRKKSQTADPSKQGAIAHPNPIAVTAPPPARTFVKASAVPTHPLAKQATFPLVTTTKLVNNPNKLINLNAPSRVPKEQSTSPLVDSYVQKPVPKLVIQVGNSESDSDPDYYPPAETEAEQRQLEQAQQSLLRDLDNASPSRVMLESPTYPLDSGATVAPEPPATEVAFETRLDQFLKTVRNKIDQRQNVVALKRKMVAPPAGGGFTVGLGTADKIARKNPVTAPPTTPSAVRHLPKHDQLEYKRLVARMNQLEKQKQQRMTTKAVALRKTIANSSGMVENGKNHSIVVTVNRDRRDVVDNTVGTDANRMQAVRRDSDLLVKRVLINNTVIAESRIATVRMQQQNGETKDESTKPPCERNQEPATKQTPPEQSIETGALPPVEPAKPEDRAAVLAVAEQQYEEHSHHFRDELQELIGTIRNAQQERQKQYDLENKVDFLREKLMILERALALHKGRIEVILPALQTKHTQVMSSRKKSIELNNRCTVLGREVKGQNYEPPSSVRHEIHEQLKVLTNETKVLKNMKRLSLDEFKEITAVERKKQLELKQQQAVDQPGQPDEPPKQETIEPTNETEPSVASECQPLIQSVKSAPTSRSSSPLVDTSAAQRTQIQEAPAAFDCDSKSRFAKYTSPLVSLQDQSALNIPDGVICPYQMRGECVDRDCKFEHFK